MSGVWGYQPIAEFYNKCDRCGEFECICGDPAFEAFVEEELSLQASDEL